MGFTILEIMVGVGVVGLVLITMYRLVASQLQALQVSREAQAQSAAMDGLAGYLQSVLAGLPVRQADCLRGIPHVFGLAPADEIQWLGRPGLSLLTSAAPEADYAVTLTIQPSTTNSRQQELGIRRRLSPKWIPLMSGSGFCLILPLWSSGISTPRLGRGWSGGMTQIQGLRWFA